MSSIKENDSNMLSTLLSEENAVDEIAVPISSTENVKEDDNKDNSPESPTAETPEKAEAHDTTITKPPESLAPHAIQLNTTDFDNYNVNAIIHPDSNNTIPELTKYDITCKCCCNIPPCVQIQDQSKYPRNFWGSHELDSVCMNVFVSGIVIFVELVHYFIVFPKLAKSANSDGEYVYNQKDFYCYSIPCLILHIITLILFLWSYFAAACMDPGFLPYNWYETRKTKYNWKEQLSGLAIRDDQVQYAHDHRPNIASFSKSAGRFVIRADHICGWIGNWVGKRNHKQFILMNFWGSLYALNLFCWHIPIFHQIMPGEGQSFYFLFTLLIFFEACVEAIFAVLLFYVCVMNLDDLRKDLTKIKKWKNERGQEYSFLKATREVFGPGNACCFICPTPAFNDNIIFDKQIEENPNEFALD